MTVRVVDLGCMVCVGSKKPMRTDAAVMTGVLIGIRANPLDLCESHLEMWRSVVSATGGEELPA